MLSGLMNHLWQSTAFAAATWLLTLVLKSNRAQTRYWVWLAASMKFLVPFALLVAAGNQVSWRTAPPVSAPGVAEPIARTFGASAPLVVARESGPAKTNPMPELLLLVWAAGFVVVLIRWGREWTRMHVNVRSSKSLDLGLPVPVRSSAALMEPGVFGVLRPVLLLPEGIAERLTAAQLDAILAHELCHVRRMDNLATAMHMVVEAVFWFHPLVWWIGARLMEERERACDEEVLRSGNDAQTYAEGILKVCEFYLRSPLECVAGVSGANLNKRIEEIVSNRMVRGLSVAKKLLLACAGMLAVVGPLAIGLMNAPPIQAQAPAGHFEFEAASVRASGPDGTFRSSGGPGTQDPGRITYASVTLKSVLATTYGVRRYQISGPSSLDSERYDIIAKIPAGATKEQFRQMLQALLADRFQLRIHRETKELPVYALVVGKGGPKLEKAGIEEKDCPNPSATPRPDPAIFCHDLSGGRGRGLHAQAADLSEVAGFVESWTDRPLLDKTGIKGLYRFETTGWLPMDLGPPPAPGAKQDQTDVADLPTIFTMFEGLGLKMESQKVEMDVYVVDHIEKPTEN
jgi:bla regulator protein BlaR1